MSPAYREPEWSDEPSARRASLDWITARPIPLSGNPLLNLSTPDALAFLGVAFGLRPADLAKSLRISRETLYVKIRRARAGLEPLAEPKLSRHCISCGGPRLPGRVRCDECLAASGKKQAAGRAGAGARWRKPVRTGAPTGARGRAGSDGPGV